MLGLGLELLGHRALRLEFGLAFLRAIVVFLIRFILAFSEILTFLDVISGFWSFLKRQRHALMLREFTRPQNWPRGTVTRLAAGLPWQILELRRWISLLQLGCAWREPLSYCSCDSTTQLCEVASLLPCWLLMGVSFPTPSWLPHQPKSSWALSDQMTCEPLIFPWSSSYILFSYLLYFSTWIVSSNSSCTRLSVEQTFLYISKLPILSPSCIHIPLRSFAEEVPIYLSGTDGLMVCTCLDSGCWQSSALLFARKLFGQILVFDIVVLELLVYSLFGLCHFVWESGL